MGIERNKTPASLQNFKSKLLSLRPLPVIHHFSLILLNTLPLLSPKTSSTTQDTANKHERRSRPRQSQKPSSSIRTHTDGFSVFIYHRIAFDGNGGSDSACDSEGDEGHYCSEYLDRGGETASGERPKCSSEDSKEGEDDSDAVENECGFHSNSQSLDAFLYVSGPIEVSQRDRDTAFIQGFLESGSRVESKHCCLV